MKRRKLLESKKKKISNSLKEYHKNKKKMKIIHLSEFSDEQLKSIILDGIIAHRNPKSKRPTFSCEEVSVGFEIISHTNKNPTTREHERINNLYKEVVNSLV